MINGVLVVIFAILLIVVSGFIFLGADNFKKVFYPPRVSDFKSCAAAGYPVTKSRPRECRTRAGRIFTERISSSDTAGRR